MGFIRGVAEAGGEDGWLQADEGEVAGGAVAASEQVRHRGRKAALKLPAERIHAAREASRG